MAVRFERPLHIVEHTNSLMICDATGRRLCYVYYEEEKSRREVTGLMRAEEAWAFARWVIRAAEAAKLGGQKDG